MTTYQKDGHTVIQASQGNFLMHKDKTIFGVEISLGDSSNPDDYDELPMIEWPKDIII